MDGDARGGKTAAATGRRHTGGKTAAAHRRQDGGKTAARQTRVGRRLERRSGRAVERIERTAQCGDEVIAMEGERRGEGGTRGLYTGRPPG